MSVSLQPNKLTRCNGLTGKSLKHPLNLQSKLMGGSRQRNVMKRSRHLTPQKWITSQAPLLRLGMEKAFNGLQRWHWCAPPYQRFGSGDGERKPLLTLEMPFEPLLASVL
ncbi:MAG: hypothetical protein KDK97_19965, partial [Verrucomicrobiales bacterium]|nr:hypothetical protein [Verrucomicrobiales bacterium]